MKYQINYHSSASSQIPGLPEHAFLALVDALREIGSNPWTSGIPDPDEPEHRQGVFGGVGLVFYRVDDDAQIVHVYHIAWAG